MPPPSPPQHTQQQREQAQAKLGQAYRDGDADGARGAVDAGADAHAAILTYLDIKGLGEPIRLALAIGGVEFVDRRVSYEEVAALRAAGKLPNV